MVVFITRERRARVEAKSLNNKFSYPKAQVLRRWSSETGFYWYVYKLPRRQATVMGVIARFKVRRI